jgi:predicted HicB family RNase H-like nuclease
MVISRNRDNSPVVGNQIPPSQYERRYHLLPKKRTVSKDRYNAKSYDRINIRIRKDGSDEITAAEIREFAELAGESINAFVLQAIRERAAQLRGW